MDAAGGGNLHEGLREAAPSLAPTGVNIFGSPGCLYEHTVSFLYLILKQIFSAVTQCFSATLKIDQISFSSITLTHAKNDKNVSLSNFFFLLSYFQAWVLGNNK